MTLSFDLTVLAACDAAFGEVNQGYPIPVYTPQNGTPFNLSGIFDPVSAEIKIKDGMEVVVHVPVFGCRCSDFPNPPTNWNLLQGDSIVARGRTYLVRSAENDGHGSLFLRLSATLLE